LFVMKKACRGRERVLTGKGSKIKRLRRERL